MAARPSFTKSPGRVSAYGASVRYGEASRPKDADEQYVVVVCDRRVRLASEHDPSSLYDLCRRWMRNDAAPQQGASMLRGSPMALPKPLSMEDEPDDALELGKAGSSASSSQLPKPVEDMSPAELLLHQIAGFQATRRRYKEERARRIARYRVRLASLMPPVAEGQMADDR
eukprot:SM000017S02878  [mRNA]  locus=s17:877159:878709:- [translate_table: standard]